MRTCKLRSLQPGDKACVYSVTASGEMGRRIRDLGLLPGTKLEIIGRAPLKDPVALRLMGTTLMLRNGEAEYVMVEVER